MKYFWWGRPLVGAGPPGPAVAKHYSARQAGQGAGREQGFRPTKAQSIILSRNQLEIA
jgi:hypothetical protein